MAIMTNLYANTIGQTGILPDTRVKNILKEIVDNPHQEIDSFFHSVRERNAFLKKYDLYAGSSPDNVTPLQLYEAADFFLSAKESNLSLAEWESDMIYFEHTDFDGMKGLIDKYQDFSFVTKNQVDIIVSKVEASELFKSGIVDNLLDTRYAVEPFPTETTNLQVLVSRNNIYKIENEIAQATDSELIAQLQSELSVAKESYWDLVDVYKGTPTIKTDIQTVNNYLSEFPRLFGSASLKNQKEAFDILSKYGDSPEIEKFGNMLERHDIHSIIDSGIAGNLQEQAYVKNNLSNFDKINSPLHSVIARAELVNLARWKETLIADSLGLKGEIESDRSLSKRDIAEMKERDIAVNNEIAAVDKGITLIDKSLEQRIIYSNLQETYNSQSSQHEESAAQPVAAENENLIPESGTASAEENANESSDALPPESDIQTEVAALGETVHAATVLLNWEEDMKAFESITTLDDGRMEKLIEKYKDIPDITEKQIQHIYANFDAKELLHSIVYKDLLETKYAVDNNITDVFVLDNVKNVTELHLLIAKVDIARTEYYLKEGTGVGKEYSDYIDGKNRMTIDEKISQLSEERNYDISNLYSEIDTKTREHFGVDEPIFLEDHYRVGDASIENLNKIAGKHGYENYDELLIVMNEHYSDQYDMAVNAMYDKSFSPFAKYNLNDSEIENLTSQLEKQKIIYSNLQETYNAQHSHEESIVQPTQTNSVPVSGNFAPSVEDQSANTPEPTPEAASGSVAAEENVNTPNAVVEPASSIDAQPASDPTPTPQSETTASESITPEPSNTVSSENNALSEPESHSSESQDQAPESGAAAEESAKVETGLTEEMKDFKEELENKGFAQNDTEKDIDKTFKIVKSESAQEITSKHDNYTFSIFKANENDLQEFRIASGNDNPATVADYPNFKKSFIESTIEKDNPTFKDRMISFFSIFIPSLRYSPELMRENPYKIQELSNPSKELQIAAVKADPSVISLINKPSKDIQMLAVQTSPAVLHQISNPPEEVVCAAVKMKPSLLEGISNPSETIQLTAINSDPRSIKYIAAPTERVQRAAIRQVPETLFSIEKPNAEMCLEAIQYSSNPQFIEVVQVDMVKQNPLSIGVFQNPSEAVQIAAVEIDPFAIGQIKNPTESAQLSAIKKDIFTLKYVDNPAESATILAVQTHPECFRMIANPTPNTCKATIESLYNIKINGEVQPDIVQMTKGLFAQLDNTNRPQKNGKIRVPSEARAEREQIISRFFKAIESQYPISNSPVENTHPIFKDQEICSSGGRSLVADVSQNAGESQIANFRVKDHSTGKTEPLDLKDIDLSKQPDEELKKLLSGGKAELIDQKGTSNLFNLTKGPAGWSLKIGQQIYAQADACAEA